MPPELIHALGLVKWAAAIANRDLGKLTGTGKNPLADRQVEALLAAAREVADGRLDDQFPVDVFQTGSGTSTNMNVNEVIANRAIELCRRRPVQPQKAIHPNDHVNMGQSTNDMFPTAIHVAVAVAIREQLHAGLARVRPRCWPRRPRPGRRSSRSAARTWSTPRRWRWGRRSAAWPGNWTARWAAPGLALDAVLELPVGGTAVGSGINTHPQFARRVCRGAGQETGIPFVEAADHFEANAQRDGLVECHGQLRAIAVTLFTVANNIRWLSSGPQTGFHEIMLPDLQPGSSIMPGKVNPVMSESLMQVAARVMGNDPTIAFCGAAGGQFQLNIMMPVMADAALESVRLLAGATRGLHPALPAGHGGQRRDVRGGGGAESGDGHRAEPATSATSRRPSWPRRSLATGKTVRQLAREKQILPDDVLEKALDPWKMIHPRGE